MNYTHTQIGTIALYSFGFGFAMCLVVMINAPMPTFVRWLVGGSASFLLFLGWLFSSLTIEITGEELTHYFGPGFWKKRYQLSDIESVEVVRNSWIYGWGIRLTPHGWLYNVSGLEAVQIQLRSGRKFRIGTDEPHDLKDAINSINAL